MKGIKATKKNKIYKCEVGGNTIEILVIGKETLVYCGQAIKLQKGKIRKEFL